jgi:hypothetical protein
MKRAHDCTDRELLIRIDERTQHLPRVVARHDRELLIAKVLFVVIIFAVAARYPWIADVLARMVG